MANFLPNALIDRMKRLAAEEMATYVSMDSVPLVRQAVLLNADKPQDLSLPLGAKVPWWPKAYYLKNLDYEFDKDPNYHRGSYSRQDAADLFVAYALNQLGLGQLPLRGLELGGINARSSILMSSLLAPNSLWLVNASDEAHYSNVRKCIAQWGLNNTWVMQQATASFKYIPHSFDLIYYHALVHLSSLHLKASIGPDKWTEDYARLQDNKLQEGLESALITLKADGYLFYVGKSIFDKQQSDFIDKQIMDGGLKTVRLPFDASWEVQEYKSAFSGCYSYLLPKDSANQPCLWLTIFHKEEDRNSENTDYTVNDDVEVNEGQNIFKSWVHEPNEFIFREVQSQLYMFPRYLLAEYRKLNDIFDVHKLGICIANWNGNDWVPTQELAWNSCLAKKIPYIALSYDQALSYLKGETIDSSLFDVSEGWYVLRYKELNLGWIAIEGE
ncbi:hypothetical protein [Sphingobacterium sp. MYb382]|uniref:hypothetical protein n=1 Tax=Sphingobacterium sp. MYb382 TaxID=2745278 RepID=UPI003099A0F1